MNQGRIEKAQRSKSGKTLRILVGDTWYSTDNWALESCVGRTVQFNVGTSEYAGKTIYWANDSELVYDVHADMPQHPAPQSQPPTRAPAPGPAPNSSAARPQDQTPSGSDLTARDFMPFTSNQVAHAIAAGLIKEPAQLQEWTRAAFNAIKNVTTVDPEFDDDIPF